MPEPRRGRRARRWVLSLLAVAGALLVAGWVAVAILAKHAEPYLKQKVIRDLGARFDSTVELGGFHVSVTPVLRVSGENLVLHHQGDAEAPPLITIEHFDFTARVIGLLRSPLWISSVHVTGLHITLPRPGQRPNFEESGKPEKHVEFVIQRIICDDAQLAILAADPQKRPLIFKIHSLVLDSAGPGREMEYTARLTEPKPLGEIAARGKIGPWQTKDPRTTPVSGVYSFTHADLATIKGIGGTLSSHGKFGGPLDRIEIQGETETPNFTMAAAGNPMHLHTDFSATVDGATGDTYLHPVRATLARSLIVANGSTVRVEGKGHLITLDVVASNARIQDLLQLAIKALPPALSGPVSLKARLVLPPSPEAVIDRLQLDGTFNMPAAQFSSAKAQLRVDGLSLRARGLPKEAKEVAQNSDDPASEVLSQLQGKFTLQNGLVTMPMLMFRVPGASITLSGDYQLSNQEFMFEGDARFDAKLSHMTTGWKSVFLRAVDPFFSKSGAGAVLPIRISGTGTSPSVHLDLRHRGK